MLKFSLVMLFVMSIATLAVAASGIPAPIEPGMLPSTSVSLADIRVG